MEALRNILLFLHLIGFAALLGGAIAQYLSGKLRINIPMLWGSGAQLVTGIALAFPLGRPENDRPEPGFLAVKLIVALMIFVMVFFARKREAVNKGHFLAIIGLTLVNAAVAVFWH
jgi:hypothetical protein